MAAPKLDFSKLIKTINELPSLPAIVYELNRVISDPMASTQNVENVMSNDIGITAKVLNLANSSYYAIPGGVSSLGRAISFIGFDTIHQLVLSTTIIKALSVGGDQTHFNINEFWKHSVGVGIASETIAKYVSHPNPSDLFTAGMIHDMGKIALFVGATEQLLSICSQSENKNKTFIEIEQEFGQMPHTELGKILGEKWKLPKAILAVARYHHEFNPMKRGALSSDLNLNVDIVILANLLIHAMKFGYSGHRRVLGAPEDLLARLMISSKTDLPPLLKQIKHNLDQASGFIQSITSAT